MFSALDRSRRPDDKTVVFRPEDVRRDLPQQDRLGPGSIVDHNEYPADKLRRDGKAVGSGVYKLGLDRRQERPSSPSTVLQGHGQGQELRRDHEVLQRRPDRPKQGLESGEVDFAYRGLAAKDIAGAGQGRRRSKARGRRGRRRRGPAPGVQHDDPVAGKLGVRKAIAYLLDREALVKDVYQGTATPLYSIVPAGIAGHNTAFFDTYGGRPQPEKAEAALRAGASTAR